MLTGRALPYGEGVAFWPIASMVKASAGITDSDPAAEAFEKLRVCCESEAVADLLGVALGVLGAAEDITAGDRDGLGRAALGRAAGRNAAARTRVRGRAVGGRADARRDRASGTLATRRSGADRVRNEVRAARGPPLVGRRQPASVGDRARSTVRARERCAGRRAAAERRAACPAGPDARAGRRQPPVPRGDGTHAARGGRRRRAERHPRQRPGPDRARESTCCRRTRSGCCSTLP